MSTEKTLVISTQGAEKAIVVAANEAAAGGQEVQKTVATTEKKAGSDAFSAKPTLGEVVEFQITGLLVVFVVLGGITILCTLMAKLLSVLAPEQFYGKKKPVAAPAAAPAPAAPVAVPAAAPVAATIHPGLSDDKLLAILATAVQEALGRPASVVKFRPMGAMDWTWSQQGRATHHASHKL